ncbi:MAG: S8 family serine peptidase [Limisphaerales bacterium]
MNSLDLTSLSAARAPGGRIGSKDRNWLGCLLIGGLFFFSSLGEPPVRGQTPPAPSAMALTPAFRADRLLVKPGAGVPLTRLAALHATTGAQVLRQFPGIGNLQVLQAPAGANVADLVATYQQSGLVGYAEPDFTVQVLLTPNDFRYWDGTLWGLHNTGLLGGTPGADIDAPDGWDVQNTATNIIVAVIDTGVRYTHEDLAANMWVNPGESGADSLGLDKSMNGRDDDGDGYIDDVHGINAILGTGIPLDDYGHGTHVSGILGGVGNNSVGVVGVAWGVQIMACKFLDSTGKGSISDAITCIDYARSKGAKIINASWGSYTFTSASLYDAIASARDAGMIFVAATGNDANNNDVNPLFPASYNLNNIIRVAATTRNDGLAFFSNYGSTTVDLGAPGLDIFSTWNSADDAYQYFSGTSMATPHVAGACALVWAHNPNLAYDQVISRILASTDPLPALAGKCVTGGRLNLRKALGTATVIAGFTASPTSGAVPLTVNFTDTSAGTVTKWQWNFGDGTPNSAQQNPVHIFNQAGNFTVTLTVTGSNGSTSSRSQAITAVANYQIQAASFNWIDPGSMAALTLGDDGVSTGLALPFTFSFYGQGYNQVYVGANGLVGFVNQGLSTMPNTVLPNPSLPRTILCPYWADLDPSSGGSVRIGTTGTAPNRQVVISWVSVPVKGSFLNLAKVTFQAVLLEGSNKIQFQYQQIEPNRTAGDRQTGTVGVEDQTGTVAAKYTYNESPSVLTNNQALLFVPTGGTVTAAGTGGTTTVLGTGTATPIVPRLLAAYGIPSGATVPQFHLQLQGSPSTPYIIQASPSLDVWVSVATNLTSTNGTLDFSDPHAGGFDRRFYRAVLGTSGTGGGIPFDGTAFSTNRILVKPRVGLDLGMVHMVLGAEVLQTFPAIGNLQIVQVPAGEPVPQAVAAYQQSGLVEYAEPDVRVQLLLTPNDFRYYDGSLWGLHNTGQLGGTPGADIDAPDAWDIQSTASNIIVAVVDTGTRYTHEDLADNMWVNPGGTNHGINAINGTDDPMDDHGHGTHISGTIGAVGNNQVGIVGVAWQVQLMSCKFIDPKGNGTVSDAITCINYARTHGAKIINASWGTTNFNSSALHDAIASARDAGMIMVAACGNSQEDNDGPDAIYPASYSDLDNIISVAATTRNDGLAVFSNYGTTTVHLGAPGQDIYSTYYSSNNDYVAMSGTSMAAAHVSGACAVVWAHYPDETYRQIISRVLAGTDPVSALAGKCTTGGRLNLKKALASANPPPPPPPLPVVTVLASRAQATETGSQTGEFTFNRTGETTAALTVHYTLSGSATNGVDYQKLPDSVTIAAGASSATLTATPLDDPNDTEPDADKTAMLTLSTDAAYQVGSPDNATVTISDNDNSAPPPSLPTVTVTASRPQATESGSQTGEFTFGRTGNTSAALTVHYTLSGTATNGVDYQDLTNSTTIPAGAATATLTVTPLDDPNDTEPDGDKTAVLTLDSDAAYQAGSPNTATVTISDDDVPGAPTADFTANPASGDAPLTVQFTDKSTGTIASWDWNFGDGSAHGTTQNPSHTYNAAGNFTVTLTVTGSGGATSSKSASIQVTTPPPAPPTADFTASAAVGLVPFSVQFTDKSTGTVTSWDWNFGDGSAHTSAQNPAHTYASAGNFTVTLTVTGSGGVTGGGAPTSSKSATIQATAPPPPAPTADFTANPTSGNAPLTVQFGDKSTGTIASWDWNFGDGSAHGTTQNPSHTYNAAGNFTVTLTVTGSGGATSSKSASIQVTTPPPLPTVTVVPSVPAASEIGPVQGQFTVARSGDTSAPLTIRYTLGGTAVNGTDYQTLSGSVTIPAGASSATIAVVPLSDALIEAPELVILTLAGDPAYQVGLLNTATVTILNTSLPLSPAQ